MASVNQNDKSRDPLRDANADINNFICNDIGNNSNQNQPKSLVVSIPPPSKFPVMQRSHQPINTVVASLRPMNGQREPISVSDTHVNRRLPDTSNIIGQNSSPTLGDTTSKDGQGDDDHDGVFDSGDDVAHGDEDEIVADESKALEAVEKRPEPITRQRLPSQRLKDETAAERRARQRKELLRMMSPGKPKEYKLCGVVIILFIISFLMFVLVLSLCPRPRYEIFRLAGRDGEKLTVNAKNLEFDITVDKKTVLSGKLWSSKTDARLPHECFNKTSNVTSLCLEWTDTQRLDITHGIENYHGHNFSCFAISWEALNEDVWHMDCFNLGGRKWFGGGLLQSGSWSIEGISIPRVPFLTGSIHKQGSLGPVLDRYWLTSDGLAVIMDDETPLHISINALLDIEQNTTDEALCLYSDFESDLADVYRGMNRNIESSSNRFMGSPKRRHGPLKYSICRARSAHEAHAVLSKRSVSEIPDVRPALPTLYRNLMAAPVWSTQQYMKPEQFNQTTLLEFSDMIASKEYGHSMLYVDNGWQTRGGDISYNPEKFDDPKKMNDELKSKGFLVTVAVTPYISWYSKAFDEVVRNTLVTDIGRKVPSLVALGEASSGLSDNQDIAAVVDFTSDASSNFLTSKINEFTSAFSVDSVYLTGSDVTSLPAVPTFEKTLANLGEFTRHACSRFAGVGRHVSTVKSAYKCQNFPLLVRQSESTSSWNQTGGLSNVISSALALNLIGYPFIIPDPVGGEFDAQDGNRFASRELYIRWLQVAVFLPVLHLSIPPHHYGNSTERIARELLSIRRSVVLPELHRVLNESITNHEPPQLLRPLWWLVENSTDPAFSIEDQFLVGDSILVAPILAQGKTRRNIYITKGLWEDTLNNIGGIHIGPKWLLNYKVSLSKVAYFIRKDLP